MKTGEFVKCKNGHLYNPKDHKECPYCPKPASEQPEPASSIRRTPPTASQLKPTTIDTAGRPAQPEKTVVEGSAALPHKPTEMENVSHRTPLLHDTGVQVRKTRLLEEGGEKKSAPIFAWLVFLEGRQQYEVMRIDREQVYLGSSPDSGIFIDDDYVSKEHASIRYRDGKFFITDLDSRNGTFVNKFDPGAGIDRVELRDGDEIRMGQVIMKFKCL